MDSDSLPTRSTSALVNLDSEVSEEQPQPSTSAMPSTSGMEIPRGTGIAEDSDDIIVKRHRYVAEVKSMWNLVKIYTQLGTREQGVRFAEERGLIEKTKLCTYHKKPMTTLMNTNNTVGSFACLKGKCRAKRISRANSTWFENVRIPLVKIYYLMYAYTSKWSYEVTIKEDFTSKEQCLSRATINDWFTYCREAVVIFQINKQEVRGKIGGPGKIVQIDESKFGKRKYSKDRHIEGHWVLGLIEDGSEDLRLELCENNVRSAEVLVPLIKKHVAEGTTIHTDCWRAYDCLGEHGFIHKKVNHSDPDNPFVAEDGTHTRRIESQWRGVKYFLKKNNFNHRENFCDMLYEYLWRKNMGNKKLDPFEELIKVIKYVYNKR